MLPDRPTIARSLLIGVLLAAATVFFLWGSFAEHSSHHDTGAARNAKTGQNTEGGESAAQHASEGTIPGVTESEYRPLGVNLESTPLIITAAVVSFALAGWVTFWPGRFAVILVLLVAVGFAALEGVEVVHQSDMDNTGLLVLALGAGVLHVAAGALSLRELVNEPRAATPVPVS